MLRCCITFPFLRALVGLVVLLRLLSFCNRQRILPATDGTTSSVHLETPSTIEKEDFFDCDREGALCIFFRPQDFFRASGRAFLVDYERLGGTNPNLPACTALSWQSSARHAAFDYMPRNVTFVHTHKCGGTTVQGAMQALRNRMKRAGLSVDLQTYKYSMGGGTAQRKEFNRQRRDKHIEAIAHAQKTGRELPVFTVVRDPVERFLSGFQQVMHYNDDLRSSCLKKTPKATIRCVIDDVRRTNYRRDVHLVPMAMHLRLFDKQDITVSVFHLRDIAAISRYFVGKIQTTKHMRDRTSVQYATSKVLARMRVADCDSDMIEDICELYTVDVAMMKSMELPTPHCR